jgi:two-component system nitrogen regulation response regulator NtrX
MIAGILSDNDYRTKTAATSDQAFDILRATPPSLAIVDIWLEGSDMDGMAILRRMKKDFPTTPVVMISGHGTIEMAVEAVKIGAYDFIEKPFQMDRLLNLVERAVESARLRRENQDLRARQMGTDEFTGQSEAIDELRRSILQAAKSNARVLFTGPPGSGKQVAARMLHANSDRADQPLITVNCATMRPADFEVELFGTAPNSDDPGARQVGLLEQAHRGTLLLDEISDMPMETQGKLVRVLQDQSFTRIGGHQSLKVDVRFIATTNRDLNDWMEGGEFRRDLYYRLNVVPIDIPALRDRPGDIPVLARHFVNELAQENGRSSVSLSQDAIAALQHYEWPGNVRQLRNAIEWVLIMMDDEQSVIRTPDLPPVIGGQMPALQAVDPHGTGQAVLDLNLREARELFEREYLDAQITRFNGNVSKTADFIGMDRSSLHRKLNKLNVDTDRKAG